jgi:xylan 1,4-beta-xylosidase
VGGPATSNFVPDGRFDGEVEDKTKHMTFKVDDIDSLSWKAVWLEDFLNYCTDKKLAVDFISTHPYPTDYALDGHGETRGRSRSIDATKTDLAYLRNLIDKSAYPEAEIHLTEWNSSPSPRDCAHDYVPAATYIVKTNLESSGLVDSLSYWTFTDVFEEGGAGDSIYHGGFGMINFQGIVKPAYHAYRFLNMLGDEELARGDGYIVTKNSDNNSICALLYNYPELEKKSIPMSPYPNRDIAERTQASGEDKEINLVFTSLTPGVMYVAETLDESNGNAIKVWKKMGCPEPPDRIQTKE